MMILDEERNNFLPEEFQKIISFLEEAGGDRKKLTSILEGSYTEDPANAVWSALSAAGRLETRIPDELFDPAYALAVKANEPYDGIVDWLDATISALRQEGC